MTKAKKVKGLISKIKHIYDPIFRENYWYVCCPTHKRFLEIIAQAGMPPTEPKHDTGGEMCVYENENGRVITIWTKNKTPDIVAHEVVHAVAYSLRHKGLPLTAESEEVYAYLTEFLIKNILTIQPRGKNGR